LELLLDNLKNVFTKKKHGATKTSEISDKKLLIRMSVTGVLSILVGRVALLFSMEPCALAFMTVLMARSKANLYALPIVYIGMISAYGASYGYLPDLISLIICTIVFLILGTKKITLMHRALIAGGIMVGVKTAYYLWSGLFFLYDGQTVAVELLVLFLFIYVFYTFLNLIDKGITKDSRPVETLAVVTIVVMVCTASISLFQFIPISLLHFMALFLTLLLGYSIGPSEGAMIGIITGVITMLIAYDTPAFPGILGCCGLVAGFLHGQRRIVTSVCFVGLALIFGLLKGYPNLYISVYEPVIAGVIFILVPRRFLEYINNWLYLINKDESFYELKNKKRIKDQLTGYRDLFINLALSCANLGAYDPARDIVCQQFKGMARALEQINTELDWKAAPLVQRRVRYSLDLGVATYAKEGRISGDSYLCTGISDSEYMIALSDGMGKGIRASEESTLTVNTLYNLLKAGFEAELALKMINSILLLRSDDEIFSTVDMGFIDLITGRAKFFKIGAASSFIKRDGIVKSIKLSALPMGIIERVPIESISLQLRKGDELIIVSDGITEADRGQASVEWVKESIQQIRSKDPQTIADLILNKAVQKYGLREKDDMTVLVAVVN